MQSLTRANAPSRGGTLASAGVAGDHRVMPCTIGLSRLSYSSHAESSPKLLRVEDSAGWHSGLAERYHVLQPMCPLLGPWGPVPLLAQLQPDLTLRNPNLALQLVLHRNRSKSAGKYDQTDKANM